MPLFTATSWAAHQQLILMERRAAAPTVETLEDAARCEIRRADVPSELLNDIERTVRLASRTLGLDPEPRVRWLPAETRGIRGVVFSDDLRSVWVKLQDVAAARETALHEVRHAYQLRGDRYKSLGLLTMEQREADADEFARTWRWDMPPVASARKEPSMLRPATHRSAPSPLAPRREVYEHKGRVHVVCEACDQGVPTNTLHRCPAAGWLGLKHSSTGYAVKAF